MFSRKRVLLCYAVISAAMINILSLDLVIRKLQSTKWCTEPILGRQFGVEAQPSKLNCAAWIRLFESTNFIEAEKGLLIYLRKKIKKKTSFSCAIFWSGKLWRLVPMITWLIIIFFNFSWKFWKILLLLSAACYCKKRLLDCLCFL